MSHLKSKSHEGAGLTPAQREILEHFAAMDDSARRDLVSVAAAFAEVSPRQRPKLRVVGGRAA